MTEFTAAVDQRGKNMFLTWYGEDPHGQDVCHILYLLTTLEVQFGSSRTISMVNYVEAESSNMVVIQNHSKLNTAVVQ